MRYFKLTDESDSRIEYIKVLDDVTEVKPKSDTTKVEEISEEDYENALNLKTSRWDLFMPTI